MQPLNTHILLKYTSAEYKYEQVTAIPKQEICVLSQSTIQELFEKNISKGFPHVLAFVHDVAKGQDVYDANLLGQYLAKNQRWKWLNPATQKTIRKIDYFVMNQLSDGYRLVKEINTEQTGTGATYEDLWFCHNLAAASDPDNPYAFQSMRAMSLHYRRNKNYQKEKEVKQNCFKSIENHYGKGIALLLIPAIIGSGEIIKRLLFHSFNYDFLDDFFLNSSLEGFVQTQGMELFNPEKEEEQEALYQISLKETLDKNSNHPSHDFVACLNLILSAPSFKVGCLYPFLNHPNKNIVALTQACLCTLDEIKDIRNLRERYPKWPFGQAFELSADILSRKTLDVGQDAPIHKFLQLSSTANDPLLLESIAEIFERYSLKSDTWTSTANICMRMIGISRFNISAVDMFAGAIAEEELDNSLSLLSTNFRLTNSYSSLRRLSDQQIAIGIKNKNKALYDEGINKGVAVFNNRDKHHFLTFSIGRTLIAEITPYKSTKELESIGVEALEYTLQVTSSDPHPVAKLSLAEYLIRKGTTLQAQKAHEWLIEIITQFPKDSTLLYYFIRYDLRFAKNEKDFNDIETKLAEIEKPNDKLPLFYLLKTLWYSHPLKRNHPEWFILASQNLAKAFKDADQSGVDFLIKNLHRFDKLTEEDLIKCKADILCLLGLGNV